MKNLIYIFLIIFTFSCIKKKESLFDFDKNLINSGFIKIPIEKEITGHLILMTKINGIKSRLLLDTGANNTVLDKKLQIELKLDSSLSDQVATGAGKTDIPVEISKNIKLEIGDLFFHEREFMIMNLDYVNNALINNGGEKINGIIGSDILIESNAIIDYSDLTLYIKKNTE